MGSPQVPSVMTMMMAIAAAILAVNLGVLLAALDQPRDNVDARLERLSRLLVIAASVTATAGATAAISGWLLA